VKGYGAVDVHKDSTFLTSIKTERASVPLKQRTPSPPNKSQPKKNESMVIVIPQLPEYSSPFKAKTINSERKSEPFIRPKFHSKSVVKLPPISHNVSAIVNEKQKSKHSDFQGIESAKFVPAVPWDATRSLLEKARARILEDNTRTFLDN